MGTIRIISASAGTGKTHRLAEELCTRIMTGDARPEAILATTFTNKAAGELKSRIRTRLLGEGRVEEALRLDAARIGTVNSVCGRLVSDFTFELGLSPELDVLDEDAAKAELRRAIPRVVGAEEMEELTVLDERLSDADWQGNVQSIVDLARTNNLSSTDLVSCADRSVAGFIELLPRPGDAAAIDADMQAALQAFVDRVEDDGKKNTKTALQEVRHALIQLRSGKEMAWQEWQKLTRLAPAVAWKEAAEPVRHAAVAHAAHPRFREDIEAIIRKVFQVAGEVLAVYTSHKSETGSIDFVDQEAHALHLLSQDEVCARLRDGLDLVLVDEFQDTSPIQLAIFLKLADLAAESIWVGDQKQAIYGFRGTDPALMDAAVTAIETGGSAVDVLDRSWRSRADLVNLTSDLFAEAFKCSDIPPARVRIEAAEELLPEPQGLGPVLERWALDASNRQADADALAAGVRELLADEKVVVRDPVSGQARRVRAGDVAILCRMNAVCDSIAAALDNTGVPAVRRRAGLLSTPEARLVVAGLRYWIDDRDALAAAELARILEYPDQGDAWLDRLVESPGIGAFEEMSVLATIRDARDARPLQGTVGVLDAVLAAVDTREMCLRWGNSDRRLDNLDALRAFAVQYAETCETEGTGCTPAGLVASLDELAGDETDMQASFPGGDSVTVSTWHSAKGREWPVTILFEINKGRGSNALGVAVMNDGDALDIQAPLAGRWIRYWPSPYHARTDKTALHDRLREHPTSVEARARDAQEQLRLLYVVWTRARDRLILVTRSGKGLDSGPLTLLSDANGDALLSAPVDGRVTWAENTLDIEQRELVPADVEPTAPVPGTWYTCPGTLPDHPPAYVAASEIGGEGLAGEPLSLGERLPLHGDLDMTRVGNAVHGFLAADTPSFDDDTRESIAGGLLLSWDVAGALAAQSLLVASDNFRAWVEAQWPGATWHREWPVMLKNGDGSIVSGTADLVLGTADGYVIIDHKSFPGSAEQAVKKAQSFGGQLGAYADAVGTATGQPVIGTFIHLPVSGIVVRVEPAG